MAARSQSLRSACDNLAARLRELDPVGSCFAGYTPGASSVTDYSPEGEASRTEVAMAARGEFAARLSETALTPSERIVVKFVIERLDSQVHLASLGEHLRLMRTVASPQRAIRVHIDLLPKATEEDWQRIGARLARVPEQLRSLRAAWQAGLDEGKTASSRLVKECAGQLDVWAGRTANESAHAGLLGRYRQRDDQVSATERAIGEAAAAAAAAYGALADWLRDEYLPRASPIDGVGGERYRAYLREYSGAQVDPIELYEWGVTEVGRLSELAAQEAGALGLVGSIGEVSAQLDAAQSGALPDAGALLTWVTGRLSDACDLFGDLVTIDDDARRIEAREAPAGSAAAPYYVAPDENARPGTTWWPTLGYDQAVPWRLAPIVFHEGVPGHHVQALAARGSTSMTGEFGRMYPVPAHTEGWAMYAENLAAAVGGYRDCAERFGYLCSALWRSVRLLVDIGLHLDLPVPDAMAGQLGGRWTVAAAERALTDHAGVAPGLARSEIVRYLGLPAQATMYRLGERMWLRARPETTGLHSLRQWHDRALGVGSIGLDLFAEAVAGPVDEEVKNH